MKIEVTRDQFLEDRTLSMVYIDGEKFCYGLEDKVREIPGKPVKEWKVYGETAIPVGEYPVEMTYSPRFKREMIHVMNVPGYTGILIHNGKGPESTEGCLIVSMSPIFNYERQAMLALEALVKMKLDEQEEVTIEFRNH